MEFTSITKYEFTPPEHDMYVVQDGVFEPLFVSIAKGAEDELRDVLGQDAIDAEAWS